jgi:hypothetical protein
MIQGLLDSPVMQLLLLAACSAVGRRLFLRRGESPTASGAIAMAIGIFVLGALQHLPVPLALITRLLTLEGLIIWAYIAASYAASYRHGTFRLHTADPVGCFAIGTWVAGTAVLARLLLIVLPEWRPLALAMGLLALVIWFWYLLIISRRYGVIIGDPQRHPATGRILLATVSTQSLVLLAQELFPTTLPRLLVQALILLGYGFYGLGVVLIARRYLRDRGWRVRDDWDNTNCILHGAMSISGLAAVQTGVLPPTVIAATWVWAGSMFVGVELIEVRRLVARVRAYGWRNGVLTYHVSQWARNFTFGMFYAFTARVLVTSPIMAVPALAGLGGLLTTIVAWGQYVVLVLLLIELALFIAKNVDLSRQRPATLVPQN